MLRAVALKTGTGCNMCFLRNESLYVAFWELNSFMGHSKRTLQAQMLFCCRAKFWLNSGNSKCPLRVVENKGYAVYLHQLIINSN